VSYPPPERLPPAPSVRPPSLPPHRRGGRGAPASASASSPRPSTGGRRPGPRPRSQITLSSCCPHSASWVPASLTTPTESARPPPPSRVRPQEGVSRLLRVRGPELVVSCKVKSILTSQHRCLLRLFYLFSPSSSSCAAGPRLLLSSLSLRFHELLVETTNLSSWMPLMGSSTCRSMGFWCRTAFLPARSSASTFGVVASAVARCQMRGGLRLSSTVVVKGANPATQLHIKMSQGSC